MSVEQVEAVDKPTRTWSSEEARNFWEGVVIMAPKNEEGAQKQFKGQDFEGTHFVRDGDWEDVVALEIPGFDKQVSVNPVVIREEGLGRKTFFVPENGVIPKQFPDEVNPGPEGRARMIFKH